MKNRKPRASPPGQRQRRNKSAGKSAPRGKPFQRGVDARRGRGPAKGAPNAGRPPEAFRQELNAILNSDVVLTQLRYMMSGAPDVSHEQFWKVLGWLADRVYGRPVQELQHSGPTGGPVDVNLTNVPDEKLKQIEHLLRAHLVA